jgi:Fur family peroxide stress response transcriptional regulator
MEIRYKKSRQRELILSFLQDTKEHPSADVIYAKLKKRFKKLSMGTVYRNLGILIEQGLVRKLDFGSTFDRFDGRTSEHYHFVCEKCGAISDIEIPPDESLNERISRTGDFQVRSHRLEFFGLCGKCRPS